MRPIPSKAATLGGVEICDEGIEMFKHCVLIFCLVFSTFALAQTESEVPDVLDIEQHEGFTMEGLTYDEIYSELELLDEFPAEFGEGNEAPLNRKAIIACFSQCTNSKMIIGCDDRVQRTTSAQGVAPWMHVGRLQGQGWACSGTLIGNRWVLTDAHCILDGNNNVKNEVISFTLGQTSLGPCGRPYGRQYVKRIYAPGQYNNASITPENKSFDWALLELNAIPPGSVPMDFGYVSWASLSEASSYSIGYPGDKTTATLWETGRKQFLDSPYRWLNGGESGLLYINNDAAGGQSGSPVYRFNNSGRKVVGTMVGSPIADCQAGRVWAARITPEVEDTLRLWMSCPWCVNQTPAPYYRYISGLPAAEPPSDGCGF